MTTEITALSEREILALAISLEEEDARIYRDLAEKVRARFPGTASILDSMREEEMSHRARLHECHLRRFGNHVLYLRRQDVKGFLKRRPLWLQLAPNLRQILRLVMGMEAETRRFYQDAANHAPSEEVRALLTDLAEAEEDHQDLLVAETRAKKQSVFPRSKSRSGEIGFMPARVVVAKFFAGAISIGGGCSLGREGPTVHIAGALASNIAGWLGIAKQGRRPALLSGAAAGLAAALNTPLSAITFVLEEIIEDLNNRGFLAQVLIASVTATFVCHIFLGEDPAFVIPSIGHFSSILYVLVIPAAGFAALAGVAFQKGTLTWRDKIKRIKGIPFFLKPAVGATIGIALTDISGVVLHSTMEDECRVKNRVR